jgi:hypothetical protein
MYRRSLLHMYERVEYDVYSCVSIIGLCAVETVFDTRQAAPVCGYL